MKEFIEKSIGMEVDIKDIDYNGRLPMIYSSLYDVKIASMHNIEWLIAIPKEKINLAQLRKNHRQIEKLLNKDVLKEIAQICGCNMLDAKKIIEATGFEFKPMDALEPRALKRKIERTGISYSISPEFRWR